MSHSFLRPSWAKCGLVCCFTLFTTLTSGVLAKETEGVSDCMEFQQTPIDNGVEYRIVNQCKQRVACNVNWTLICGDAPSLRHIKGAASTIVLPTAERSITASASVCAREGWEITNVTWSCSP